MLPLIKSKILELNVQSYFEEKKTSSVPSEVYNLVATLDKLDTNPRWDQACTLREEQSATGSREMLSGSRRGTGKR